VLKWLGAKLKEMAFWEYSNKCLYPVFKAKWYLYWDADHDEVSLCGICFMYMHNKESLATLAVVDLVNSVVLKKGQQFVPNLLIGC
jgi:hypothetical protein